MSVPLNANRPLNDESFPLDSGTSTSGATDYPLGTLSEGIEYRVVLSVKNTEGVPGSDVTVIFSTEASTEDFTELFGGRDGVGLKFEVAFVQDAKDPDPTWTDVTSLVRSVTFSRGRQRELERWQPGQLTAVLDNRGRNFDMNVNPYALPMRRVRVRAQYNSIGYPLWYGFADSWAQTWSDPSKHDAYVTLTATDAFKAFNNETLKSPYFYEVLTDQPSAYYRLNEQTGLIMADSSGHTRNGTYSTDATSHSTSGLVGFDSDNGIAFDGASDYALVSSAGQPPNYPFTFECWFQTSAASAPLWFQTTGDTNYYVIVVVSSGQVIATVSTPSSDIYTKWGSGGILTAHSAGASYADGQPHHVMVRFQNSSTAPVVYVDGADVTSGSSVTGVAALPTGTSYIARSKAAASFAAATIDEIAFYFADLGALAANRHYLAGTTPWAGDTTGDRVARILNAVNWPDTQTTYDGTGNTLVSSQETDGKTALELLLQCADTEAGAFYMNADGTTQFRERHAVLQEGPFTTPRFVFGDAMTELPYAALDLGPSDELLRNDIAVDTSGGVKVHLEDTVSIDQFLRLSWSPPSQLLLQGVDDATAFGQWVLAHYKDPFQRINGINVKARKRDRNPADVWHAVLGLDLQERITVVIRPESGGPISQDAHVEGMTHTLTRDDWEVTYQLSPADTQAYMTLDDAVLGLLDTNRVAY